MPPKEKKKPGKPHLSPKERIVKAALALAAEQPWEFVTVRDITDAADMRLAEFYHHFEAKHDVVIFYGRELDNKVLENFSDYNPETPPKDLIFDILMERFDLAVQDKEALKSIASSWRKDPKQVLFILPHMSLCATRMLEAAGIDAYGLKGSIRVAGLSLVIGWVARTWLDDDTPDLTKTMAALDKALSKIDGLADRFGL